MRGETANKSFLENPGFDDKGNLHDSILYGLTTEMHRNIRFKILENNPAYTPLMLDVPNGSIASHTFFLDNLPVPIEHVVFTYQEAIDKQPAMYIINLGSEIEDNNTQLGTRRISLSFGFPSMPLGWDIVLMDTGEIDPNDKTSAPHFIQQQKDLMRELLTTKNLPPTRSGLLVLLHKLIVEVTEGKFVDPKINMPYIPHPVEPQPVESTGEITYATLISEEIYEPEKPFIPNSTLTSTSEKSTTANWPDMSNLTDEDMLQLWISELKTSIKEKEAHYFKHYAPVRNAQFRLNYARADQKSAAEIRHAEQDLQEAQTQFEEFKNQLIKEKKQLQNLTEEL